MAFQSVPDTAAARAKFTGPDGTTPSFTVYSKNAAAPWDASQLTILAESVRDELESSYLPLLSNAFTLVSVEARDLEAEFGRVVEAASGSPGTLASPALPAQTAVVVTWIGDPGAAPPRGRVYLLPPAESQVVGSLLGAGVPAALLAAMEALSTAAGPGAAAHVIVSRYGGAEPTLVNHPDGTITRESVKRVTALTNTLSSVRVGSRVDTQRRRLPRE